MDRLKDISRNKLLAQNGPTFLLKVLKIKETNQHGNLILMVFGKICNLEDLMLPAGINIMDCGQVKPSLFSLLTPDGFI